MSAIIKWLKSTVGEDSTNAVAANAGIVASTLFRQIRAETLTPEVIVAIARAYKTDPIDGLITSGLITEEDLQFATRETFLQDLTDRELADEVWQRMQRGQATDVITDGQHNLAGTEE